MWNSTRALTELVMIQGCVLWPGAIAAAGALRIHVVDSVSGVPVGNAEVLADQALVATTDECGTCLMVELPAGPHVVRVRRIGYVDATVADLNVGAEDTVVCRVLLRAAPLDMPEVSVFGRQAR